MDSRQFALLPIIVIALSGVLGCVADEEEPLVDAVGFGAPENGAADTFRGSDMSDDVERGDWDELYMAGTECSPTANVLSVSENRIVYSSFLHVVRPHSSGQLVKISADGEGMFTQMAMRLWVRNIGETEWEEAFVGVTIGGQEGELYSFTNIEVDTREGVLTFEHPEIAPNGYSVTASDFRSDSIEIGVTVFPYKDWGDLEGFYTYTLEVTCDNGNCMAPAGVDACPE